MTMQAGSELSGGSGRLMAGFWGAAFPTGKELRFMGFEALWTLPSWTGRLVWFTRFETRN